MIVLASGFDEEVGGSQVSNRPLYDKAFGLSFVAV